METQIGRRVRGTQSRQPSLHPFVAERSLLYTELLARLHFFATSHPALVGQLCQQAQSWFRLCAHPVLVPLGGFLQPPGGPLRATLSGCHKGESPQGPKIPASTCLLGGSECWVFEVVLWDSLVLVGRPQACHQSLPLLSHAESTLSAPCQGTADVSYKFC